MSQFRPEVLPFPWLPLLLSAGGLAILFFIVRWVVDYGKWIWNNRPAVGERHARKKKHSGKKSSSGRKRKGSVESSSSSDDDDSSSD